MVTLPANTTESAPVEERVQLDHGVITHVEVESYKGSARLARAFIRHELHQLAPANPDGYFRMNGQRLVWSEYYELFEPPYELIVGGWNADDTYDHDITFRFEVTPREVAERGKTAAGLINTMRGILGI